MKGSITLDKIGDMTRPQIMLINYYIEEIEGDKIEAIKYERAKAQAISKLKNRR